MHGAIFLLFYRRGGTLTETVTTDTSASRALCFKRIGSYVPGISRACGYSGGVARASEYHPGVSRAQGC